MGTDIHTYVERRINGKWEAGRELQNEVFGDRNYDVFGFLANGRNICAVPAIAAPRGLPDDVSDFVRNAYQPAHQEHTPSWLLASELLAFDYDQPVEDCQITRPEGNSRVYLHTCGPGEGRMTTY